MPEIVIDNSVIVAWCFPDEKNSYAIKVLKTLSSFTAMVPAIWPVEAANVFLVGERKRRSTAADTSAWTRFLEGLPIIIDNQNLGRLFDNMLSIARIYNLSAYDAAYLELAIHRVIPLATLDDKLRNAATAAGVEIYNPK